MNSESYNIIDLPVGEITWVILAIDTIFVVGERFKIFLADKPASQ